MKYDDLSKIKFITYGIQFDESKFKKAKTSKSRYYRNKPDGGLWCSPKDSVWGWKDWCKSEDFGTDYLCYGTEFTLNSEAKILIIDSFRDFINAINKYGRYFFGGIMRTKHLDFDKIIEDGYDGIMLTDKGNSECHLPMRGPYEVGDLNTWDCESLVLFNKDCIENIRLFSEEEG